jgi:hypothetical protein
VPIADRTRSQHWAGPWTFAQRAIRFVVVPAAIVAGFFPVGSTATLLVLFGAAVSLLGFIPTRVTVDADGVLLQWLAIAERIPWSTIEDASMQEIALMGRWGPQAKRHDLAIDRTEGVTIYLRNAPPALLNAIKAWRRG